MGPTTTHQQSLRAEQGDADLKAQAQAALQAGRFAEAARLLGRVIERDPATFVLTNLARNLAALAECRADLVDPIATAPDSDRYELGPAPAGGLTVYRTDGPTPQPIATPVFEPTVAEATGKDLPLTLAGLGNGQLLNHLAANPPSLLLSQQQLVYVIEPDLSLARLVMMVADLTEPIRQPRFRWLVGPGASEALTTLLADEPHLQTPEHVLFGEPAKQALMDELIVPAVQARHDRDEVNLKRITEWDAAREPERLIELLRDDAPHRPRVMLLTSRFTTVLQHACRDAQAAFDELGWESHLFIEPTDHHRCTPSALAGRFAEFQPDLIFQIDHQRHEFGNFMPKRVPFVCWVQDLMPGIFNSDAGAKIGPLDFVLTDFTARLHHEHGYPTEQMIYLNKATRPVETHQPTEQDIDLLFVSHGGAPVADMLDTQFGDQPQIAAVLKQTAKQFEQLVDQDDFDLNQLDIETELDRAAEATGSDPTFIENNRKMLTDKLFHPVFDRVYRHQAVGWAADLAERDGLSLALYGQGWEQHPRFAAYARGVVAYGEQLEELTRRSRISLQVVPFACLHQRLLDGLSAGGFFLVRRHPFDTNFPRLHRLLDTCCDGVPATADEALRLIDPAQRSELQALFDEGFGHGYPADEMVWNVIVGDHPGHELPDSDRVAFGGAEEFAQRVRQYLANDHERQQIAKRQAAYVQTNFSYVSQMRRVVDAIAQRLAGGAA